MHYEIWIPCKPGGIIWHLATCLATTPLQSPPRPVTKAYLSSRSMLITPVQASAGRVMAAVRACQPGERSMHILAALTPQVPPQAPQHRQTLAAGACAIQHCSRLSFKRRSGGCTCWMPTALCDTTLAW